jgi:hypothetical protein
MSQQHKARHRQRDLRQARKEAARAARPKINKYPASPASTQYLRQTVSVPRSIGEARPGSDAAPQFVGEDGLCPSAHRRALPVVGEQT